MVSLKRFKHQPRRDNQGQTGHLSLMEQALKDNFKVFSDFQLRMILDEEGNSVEDRVRQRKQLNEEDPN